MFQDYANNLWLLKFLPTEILICLRGSCLQQFFLRDSDGSLRCSFFFLSTQWNSLGRKRCPFYLILYLINYIFVSMNSRMLLYPLGYSNQIIIFLWLKFPPVLWPLGASEKLACGLLPYTSSFFIPFLLKGTPLVSGTTICSKLLDFPCLSPTINLFSKELWFLLLENKIMY